jgi:tetratricopeptide (TPR) repeat protein
MLAWTAIVQTYIAEKDYAAGIKACEAALGSETIGPEAREIAERQIFYYTAYCYELSGDIKSAKEWYEKLTKGDEAGGPWTLLADRRLADVQRRADTQPGNGPPGDGAKNPEKDIDMPGND